MCRSHSDLAYTAARDVAAPRLVPVSTAYRVTNGMVRSLIDRRCPDEFIPSTAMRAAWVSSSWRASRLWRRSPSHFASSEQQQSLAHILRNDQPGRLKPRFEVHKPLKDSERRLTRSRRQGVSHLGLRRRRFTLRRLVCGLHIPQFVPDNHQMGLQAIVLQGRLGVARMNLPTLVNSEPSDQETPNKDDDNTFDASEAPPLALPQAARYSRGPVEAALQGMKKTCQPYQSNNKVRGSKRHSPLSTQESS